MSYVSASGCACVCVCEKTEKEDAKLKFSQCVPEGGAISSHVFIKQCWPFSPLLACLWRLHSSLRSPLSSPSLICFTHTWERESYLMFYLMPSWGLPQISPRSARARADSFSLSLSLCFSLAVFLSRSLLFSLCETAVGDWFLSCSCVGFLFFLWVWEWGGVVRGWGRGRERDVRSAFAPHAVVHSRLLKVSWNHK